MDGEKQVNEVDFYSILNLPKNATDLDVKTAYKKAVLLYHPDKHVEECKGLAEERFQLIQKAFEVLSSPGKRFIYDKYGPKAVEKNWSLIPFSVSTDELLYDFERRANLEKEINLQKQIQSKGEIQVALNATRLFTQRIPGSIRSRTNQSWLSIMEQHFPEISHALVVHSWETTVMEGHNITLKGTVFAKNGLGHANIAFQGRQILSSSMWLEASASVGDRSETDLKLTKHLTSETFMTIRSSFSSLNALPSSNIVIGRQLSPNTTTFLGYTPDWKNIWGLGGKSTCVIGMNYKDESVIYGLDVQASIRSCQVSLRQTRSFFDGLYRLKTDFALGNTIGIALTLGADQKVNEITRAGLNVECGSVSGVTLRLKVNRRGQKFTVPVLLAEENDAVIALLAVAIPIAGYFTIDRLFLRKYRIQKQKEKLTKLRQENRDILEARKREAISSTLLLSQTLAKRLDTETKTEGGGLVILEALYGKLPPSSTDQARLLSPAGIEELVLRFQTNFETFLNRDSEAQKSDKKENNSVEEYIDVTIAVQALVSAGQLHIPASTSKSQILGFYDPCFGEEKQLRVIYQVGNKLHSVTVNDTAALDAPLRGILLKLNN